MNTLFPLYMKNRIHNNKYYIKTRFQSKDKTLCVYVETQSNFSYVFPRVKRTQELYEKAENKPISRADGSLNISN